jgi:hypothetical protein
MVEQSCLPYVGQGGKNNETSCNCFKSGGEGLEGQVMGAI